DAAGTGISRPLLPRMRGARRGDLLSRTPALVGEAGVHEAQRGLVVEGEPLALHVGAVGTSHVRPLVPVEAEPAQRAEDALRGARPFAWLVQIFHAEDEGAAARADGEPREERRARVAQVKVARGGGGEAPAEGAYFPRVR